MTRAAALHARWVDGQRLMVSRLARRRAVGLRRKLTLRDPVFARFHNAWQRCQVTLANMRQATATLVAPWLRSMRMGALNSARYARTSVRFFVSIVVIKPLSWTQCFPLLFYDSRWVGRTLTHFPPTGSKPKPAEFVQRGRSGDLNRTVLVRYITMEHAACNTALGDMDQRAYFRPTYLGQALCNATPIGRAA